MQPLLHDNYALPNPRKWNPPATIFAKKNDPHAEVSTLYCTHPVAREAQIDYSFFSQFGLTYPRGCTVYVMRNVQIGPVCRPLKHRHRRRHRHRHHYPSLAKLPSLRFSAFPLSDQLRVRPCRRLESVLVNGKHFIFPLFTTPSLRHLRSERTGGPLLPSTVIQRRGRSSARSHGSCARIDQACFFGPTTMPSWATYQWDHGVSVRYDKFGRIDLCGVDVYDVPVFMTNTFLSV